MANENYLSTHRTFRADHQTLLVDDSIVCQHIGRTYRIDESDRPYFIFKNWIGSSLSFVLAFSISIIEILVALLQAYIFTVLSALYFGFAVEEHDENDDH